MKRLKVGSKVKFDVENKEVLGTILQFAQNSQTAVVEYGTLPKRKTVVDVKNLK